MPNTKYNREYLKNHFFYSKRLYLAVIIIAVALAEVGFTMTRYQAPDERLVDIQLIGSYADVMEVEELTANLLAAGQAYELERDRAAGIDVESPEYEIPLQELTVSIFRHTYPRIMLAELEEAGLKVDIPYPGIYRISGAISVPAQIVVMSKLPVGGMDDAHYISRAEVSR